MLAGHAGDLWDNYEVFARKFAVDQGNDFYSIEGAEYDRWVSTLAPVTDAWLKDMRKDGYDAERLLKKAQDLIVKYETM
jgi:hypothetical protein